MIFLGLSSSSSKNCCFLLTSVERHQKERRRENEEQNKKLFILFISGSITYISLFAFAVNKLVDVAMQRRDATDFIA